MKKKHVADKWFSRVLYASASMRQATCDDHGKAWEVSVKSDVTGFIYCTACGVACRLPIA